MSMLSAQCDKLRELAARYDELQVGAVKAVTMPSDMGSILRDAADTIWQLRDDLQRTNAENAKLRKIAHDVALPLSIACDMFNIRCCECAFTKVKTCPVPELEEQLKELGIEANDG